jgi:hypothetical protein
MAKTEARALRPGAPFQMDGCPQFRIINERELILRRIGRELRHVTAYMVHEPLTVRMIELLGQLRGSTLPVA